MNDVPGISHKDVKEVYDLFKSFDKGVTENGLKFSCNVGAGSNNREMSIYEIVDKLTRVLSSYT